MSASYQNAFPKISFISSAIFTTPTVYYAGSLATVFYNDLTSVS
jgi:hypothetical protein